MFLFFPVSFPSDWHETAIFEDYNYKFLHDSHKPFSRLDCTIEANKFLF